MSARIWLLNLVIPECVQYVVEHSRADVMVVSDDEQLQKLESLMDHDLAVVQYEGLPSRPGVISWQELLEIGDSVSDTVLTRRLENQVREENVHDRNINEISLLQSSINLFMMNKQYAGCEPDVHVGLYLGNYGTPKGSDALPRQHHLDHSGETKQKHNLEKVPK